MIDLAVALKGSLKILSIRGDHEEGSRGITPTFNTLRETLEGLEVTDKLTFRCLNTMFAKLGLFSIQHREGRIYNLLNQDIFLFAPIEVILILPAPTANTIPIGSVQLPINSYFGVQPSTDIPFHLDPSASIPKLRRSIYCYDAEGFVPAKAAQVAC
ncbi:hypothetical protein PSHT_04417 [Puccinia striiformis]|uniref:Uncharacterized protein n=1 Tax=Puccinia striiformis TaxID=27350 RepID=A0A2S4WD31_9BASI|nr:hypothetical protein PSHT_04417 [Puccinia striiformis]